MKRQRRILSARQAQDIYALKHLASTSASTSGAVGQSQEVSFCILLAAKYCVSSKTIRDIWNRKTWVFATENIVDQELDHRSCMDLQVRTQIEQLPFCAHK